MLQTPKYSIELLAPARNASTAIAAINNGADAVYIGGARFGARQAAGNSVEEIARVVDYAHRYGVRVHATLNTLLRDNELADAEVQARALIAAGVDALIVQDMALRRMNLQVELHASTQMFNRSPEGARFLAEAGFARVILERALSLEEIRAVCAATTAEVECFVHGAICVGYSGRCFLSRSMSDRSGNRGACSQPCRQTWDLTDGRGHRYIAGKHLLSVRDLNLSGRIGELLDAGVSSFKIEGRLKDTGYIKNVVAYYRRAIDKALAVRPQLQQSSVGESLPDFTPDPAKSFTRGESTWFIDGRRAGVASFDTPKSVGEPLGRVAQLVRDGFRLDRACDSLVAGARICFVSPEVTFGTNVNA
ncbi:MAG: U32 family peptidase, partial [Alistipes sp.]|nr:U32 family peptidase [Alistipes sp.]